MLALYIRLELHNFVNSGGRSTGCLAVRTTGFARLCCSRCPRASRRTNGGAPPRSTPSTLAYCTDIASFAPAELSCPLAPSLRAGFPLAPVGGEAIRRLQCQGLQCRSSSSDTVLLRACRMGRRDVEQCAPHTTM